MSFVTAYFDESNSPRASAVAGIVAEAEQLDRLNEEWSEMLDREGLRCFHMKDFAHSKGEIESWKGDERRRVALLTRIRGIISRRARIAVGVVIDRHAYTRVCSRSAGFAQMYSTEYTAAGFMSLLKCSNWADKMEVPGPIAFVFDRGNSQRPDFQRAYDLCMQDPVSIQCKFGALTFADDCIVKPLQAADFVAYEVCKVYTDLANDQPRFRESLRLFLDTVPTNVSIGTEDLLMGIVNKWTG